MSNEEQCTDSMENNEFKEELNCLLNNSQSLQTLSQNHGVSKDKNNLDTIVFIDHNNKQKLDVENDKTDDSQSEPSCLRRFLTAECNDVTSTSFWRACLAEFLGTFLLCFFAIGMELHMVGGTPATLLQMAVGVGFFIAVLVTAFAAVSGCQINPAVTFGFALLRHISVIRAVMYTIFQCAGAVTGSFVLWEIIHPDMIGRLGVILPASGITDKQAIVMEVIVTSFLLFVICSAVDKGRTDIQGSVPLIIGLTVCVCVLVGGQTSGACMNPARAIGPAVVMANYQKQWIYWLGPYVGGAFGALLYDRIFSSGACCSCTSWSCCGVSNKEYDSALKKEKAKLVMEVNALPEAESEA